MKNILIINAHHRVPGISEGALNATFADKAKSLLEARGYVVKTTKSEDEYDIQEEIEKHLWADAVLIQSPVYWMGPPWSFKKYMDTVYLAGAGGALCNDDGRSRSNPKGPKAGYGTGGTQQGKKYMVSLTFNAPLEAFNDPEEYLFQGKSLDDLLMPLHMTYRFMGYDEALPTFAAHDVLKNPTHEQDFIDFEAHLDKHFPLVSA